MVNILNNIINHKKAQLKTHQRRFYQAMANPGLSVISEIKRASPAKGVLRNINNITELAKTYQQSGTNAISVLTDEQFFHGSNHDFTQVRATTNTPMLRKDFIIDDSQIIESVKLGADAILLIMAALTDQQALSLYQFARRCQLDVLVETHNQQEINRAIAIGADIIGINNRNLKTLTTDIAVSLKLRHCIPEHIIAIAESGIMTASQAEQLHQAGFDGILAGEALVTSKNPAQLIKDFKHAH